MGLFSFIKDAGANIFGIGKTTKEELEDASKAKAQKLLTVVNSLGFNAQDIEIYVEDDTATIFGEAESQEVREKIILVVGNTDGIASVDDRMTVKLKAEEAKFHTVVKGEYLSKIAKKYYGDAMKYPVIFEANKPMLKHPDKIYPGQVLRIPKL